MKTPAQIFALARPAPQKPIAELLADLRALEPPPKSPELIAAEEELRVLREAQQKLVIELREKALIAREAEANAAYAFVDHVPTKREIWGIEFRIADGDGAITDQRLKVEELQQPWRREYVTQVIALADPVRVHLHALLDEIRSCMGVLGEVAHKALVLDVGTPALARGAPYIIGLLTELFNVLDADKQSL